MADTQGKILSRYGIDISQENVFKLYKIDGADISSQELETRIRDARKRWNTSINGANEKNAERDRARLEKADQYEAILRDAKIRKEVFDYYQKSSEKSAGQAASPGGGTTEFAREYFALIATTKKIKKADVDFFFKYYQSERKNKKAILDMLSKEMKMTGLGKEGSYADEDDTKDREGKKKNDSSPLIVNLFQEATVLKIRRAIEKQEEAAQSSELCQRYPKLREGLFAFLEIKDIENAKQFTELMTARGKEVYAVRQECGTEYVPLVDLFNILQSLGEYQDVADNFPKFMLLLKYPSLTPYMFSFVEMKPDTMKEMVRVANREYSFRDDADFILNYYKPVHDNFGISDSSISSLLRKAEKKARQNKVLNGIDEKLGRDRSRRRLSVGAELIHFLAYWPVFAVYLVFEIAKVIFTRLHKLAIPIFFVFFGVESWLLPAYGIDNLLILRKLFFKNQWLSYLQEFLGESGVNGFETLFLSLIAILFLLAINILPGLFAAFFVTKFADDFNKRFDWLGIERTFRQIFATLKRKTQEQYAAQKKLFLRRKVPSIAINIVCLFAFIAVFYFAPMGLRALSEITGYGQKEVQMQPDYDDSASGEAAGAEETAGTEDPEEDKSSMYGTMVITASSANIRSGPGTDYDVITTAPKGEVFAATGNQETASNGRIWYEIYLDVEMTQTGWASQKVIDFCGQ